MIIMGVDPGSRITGYGVIRKTNNRIEFVSCGIIKTSPSKSFPERLKELHDGISEVLDRHNPQFASVEDIFFAKNPKSALKLGQARGALIVAIMNKGVAVREYSAKLVKQTISGYGQASKAQVQNMVRALLSLSVAPSEDAADALASAICLASHIDSY